MINVATGGRISLNELLRVMNRIVGTSLEADLPGRAGRATCATRRRTSRRPGRSSATRRSSASKRACARPSTGAKPNRAARCAGWIRIRPTERRGHHEERCRDRGCRCAARGRAAPRCAERRRPLGWHLVHLRSRSPADAPTARASASAVHAQSVSGRGARRAAGCSRARSGVRTAAVHPVHESDAAPNRPHQHWRLEGAGRVQQRVRHRASDDRRGAHCAPGQGCGDSARIRSPADVQRTAHRDDSRKRDRVQRSGGSDSSGNGRPRDRCLSTWNDEYTVAADHAPGGVSDELRVGNRELRRNACAADGRDHAELVRPLEGRCARALRRSAAW